MIKKGSAEEGIVYHAGFPNAAEDQNFGSLSLDSLVVKHRASTFFWRLAAETPELHWRAGAVLVVDRALTPTQGKIVVAVSEGDFVLARFHQQRLVSLDNRPLTDETVVVWGVVTYVLQEAA